MYENLTVGRATTHFSLEKKQFVDIIPPSKVIDENVQHYYGQRLYIFPVLQHLTHIGLKRLNQASPVDPRGS